MQTICQQHELLIAKEGVVRIPFLVKGCLVTPPPLARSTVEAAFAQAEPGASYVRLPTAQIVRKRMIDRTTLRMGTDYLYQVMPIVDPHALIETTIDPLVSGPYALPVGAIADYLQAIAHTLQQAVALLAEVRLLYGAIAEYPDAYLDATFAALSTGLDPASALTMIDRELALWGRAGREFLEDWVALPAQPLPNLVALLAQNLPAGNAPPSLPAGAWVRAMPTRQLHITAGNTPTAPLLSTLRLLLTKSVGVVKWSQDALLPGALFALALLSATPDHPLTRHLSLVYWPGGDAQVEQALFAPNAFDRIVVWGALGAVTAVQAKALLTKTLTFNPRYGVTLIGPQAFTDDLQRIARSAACDVLINNQQACNAAHVQYVAGTLAQATSYAEALRQALSEWDQLAPPVITPAHQGQVRRLRRGKYIQAQWHLNMTQGDFTSGVILTPEAFDLLDHPLGRLVVVRPVADLEQALGHLHGGVSTVGVYPESQRMALRDRIAARGVSNILPLGQCECTYAATPHDGMIVLSQLVDWKNA